MNFEDHFSKQAETYVQFRPRYPQQLFQFLSEQTSDHQLAWDCATGSGQAAQSLIPYYDRVIATDASAEQINNAPPHERIDYRIEPAEESSLDSHSVDLVTVAIALHWFDFERFYQEVRRVVRPGGIIAAWTYHRPQITPEIDQGIANLEDQVLGEYWPEQLHYLREHYQTLPFPFVELSPPAFRIEAEWNLDQMLGFFNTWSAVRRFKEKSGFHPFKLIWDDFLAAWGERSQTHHIVWPLYMRVGRV
jgi:SAM-dependent methyltransferase